MGPGPGDPGQKLPVVSSTVTNSLQSLEEEVPGITPKPEAEHLPGIPPSSFWLKRKDPEASEGGGDKRARAQVPESDAEGHPEDIPTGLGKKCPGMLGLLWHPASLWLVYFCSQIIGSQKSFGPWALWAAASSAKP